MPPPLNSAPAPAGIAPLRGGRLYLAWLICALVALAYLAGLGLALAGGQEQAALARLGRGGAALAGYFLALEALRALSCVAIAALLVWRLPRDALALFAATVTVAAGASIPSAAEALAVLAGAGMPADFAGPLGGAGLVIAFFLLFPSGRFAPPWAWAIGALWLAWGAASALWPGGPLDPATWPPPLQFGRVMLGMGAGLATQLYRYRCAADAEQRYQTRWVLLGALVTYAAALGFVALPGLFPALLRGWGYLLIGSALRTLLIVALPVSMAVAALRFGLWRIAPLMSRAIAYALLSLCLAAIYALVVGLLGLLLNLAGSPLAAFAATVAVALLFQPLRDTLQRAIARLAYGERADPYAVLARLGRRLEASEAPATILPAMAETIAQAMRLPYVAIELGAMQDAKSKMQNAKPKIQDPRSKIQSPASPHQDAPIIAAAFGAVAPNAERFALTYQGAGLGWLIAAPPPGEAALASADRRLLADLARQAGAAAHAVQLDRRLRQALAELQQARERLVIAREEERRRIRRDLHDGVGPALASVIQRIDRARTLLERDPAAADAALTDLKGLVRQNIGELRRLVYALRPPALDELGLLGALRQHIAALAGALDVTLQCEGLPPTLPAAAEVATYRIALEALTNVVRHAGARRCWIVVICAGPTLSLTIDDDGSGLPPGTPAGVGLSAMRERAAELGGQLRIEASPAGGARVVAELPLG